MKQISHWAKAHPIQSRWLIAASHILLSFLAVFSASLLYLNETIVPSWIIIFFAQVFFLAFFFYPKRSALKGWYKYSYARQKTHDFTLILSCFLVLLLGVLSDLNQNNSSLQETKVRAQLINYTSGLDYTTSAKKTKKIGAWKQFRQVRKQFKQELRQLKKTFKKQEESQRNWIKVLLTLLTIAVATGLILLVAALSCSLSCNGMDGLGIMVLIVGWGAVIWLGILAIKKIVNKDWSKPKVPVNS